MSNNRYYKDTAFEKGFIGFAAAILLILGLAIFLSFYFEVTLNEIKPPEHGSNDIERELSRRGLIGDYIGGIVGTIFSLVGVALLIRTFQEQRISFERERFETRLFEQIRIHRDNVQELEYTFYEEALDPTKHAPKTAFKRKVFKTIFSDFSKMYNETLPFFEDEDPRVIYQPDYLKTLKENITITERKISFTKLAQIDILYSILFIGLSKSDFATLDKLFFKRYLPSFYLQIMNYLKGKPKRDSTSWKLWNSFSEDEDRVFFFQNKDFIELPDTLDPALLQRRTTMIKSIYNALFVESKHYKYYGGHQFRLGHYFRHLYQTIKSVDDSPLFSYLDKYKYIAFVRAQLSTYEQVIFFLNSLSSFGRVWELENQKDPRTDFSINRQLITKYNLIKNIADDELVANIKVSDFYPNVSYEIINTKSLPIERERLEFDYS